MKGSHHRIIARIYLLASNIFNCPWSSTAIIIITFSAHIYWNNFVHFTVILRRAWPFNVYIIISPATHLLAISFLSISVVHHINQWQLRQHRVFYSIRYFCVTLFAFSFDTRVYNMVCVILVCLYIYVYMWRTTIFYYIYRMKTLPTLSFWRPEKIFILCSIVSLLLAPT
jgi:hypothetical protein